MMIFNKDGVTVADCIREAEALETRASKARVEGRIEYAHQLSFRAESAQGLATVMAGETPADDEGEFDIDAELEAGEGAVDDDLVWWVLVDGYVFLNEPVADGAEALKEHARTVEMMAKRGVDRARISLVQVGRLWGRSHFTGS